MLRSIRPVHVIALGAAVALAAWSIMGLRASSELSAGGSSASAEGLLATQMAVPGMRWLIGDEQMQADARSARVNPEAIVARLVSRTAYEHLDSGVAVGLARRLFPALVAAPAGGAPALPGDEKIVRYLSPNAAAVSAPGTSHGVIEASEPIAHRTQSGGFVPIDLSLVKQGDAYVPKSSTLPIVVPNEISSGVQMPGEAVSLTPVGPGGAAVGGATGSLAGASAVYANTQRDTDTVVRPTTAGFELSSVLRSVESPTRLSFRVGMPSGARLVALPAADGARVVKEGQTLATIVAPLAQDVSGTSMPISASVAGDILTLKVEFPSAGPDYPVFVDPYAVDEQLTGQTHPTRWKFCAAFENPRCGIINAPQFKSTGWKGAGGLTMESSGYSSESWASFNYQTQGESKINMVTASVSGSHPSGTIETVAQLIDGKESEEESKWVIEDTEVLTAPPSTSYSYSLVTVCPKYENGTLNCNTGAGARKNLFRFESSSSSSGTSSTDTISKPAVSISQTNNPSVAFNTASETIAGQPNVLHGSGSWLGRHLGAYEIEAKDPGVGIDYLSIASGSWLVKHAYLEESRCEGIQCFPEVKEPYTYNEALKDGEDIVQLRAETAMASSGVSTTAKIKVDGTAPTGVNLFGLPASKEISEQVYALKAEATDGSGSVESSGIKSVTLAVNGQEIPAKVAASCSPGPCIAKGEWNISAENIGAGEGELTVTATDNAGNETTKSYEIVVRHATPTSAGPGSVNPVTGNFTLSATDAAVGGSSSLGVSRTYNSRQLAAGSEGPLGGQWTLDVAPVQKVEQTSDGVMLIGADGGATSFAKNGSGGFNSPRGDQNLSMSEVKEGEKTKEYILSDAAAGTKTRFTLPEGATTGPWMPEIAEGIVAASSGTDTYKFKTVEVAGKKIVEPVEVLAPVPSGVTECKPVRNRGCRLLTFNYATATTATGEGPSGWGDYNGHLTRVYLTAWDPKAAKMTTTELAQYAYDSQGRLRAEWDPRISPALKTLYGYDSAGHVTAISPPGQQPWLFAYGSNAGDLSSGRLVSVSRPPASSGLGEGTAPVNTAVPKLSSASAVLGKAVSVNTGSWSNAPLAYSYQWQRCGAGGTNCAPIYGARNQSYTPVLADMAYTLVAQVTAVNAGGSVTSSTTASESVAAVTPTSTAQYGSEGTGNAQFKTPAGASFDASGNLWIADSANNRIEELSSTGAFVAAYGTSGTGNGQFKTPWGLAIDKSGNVYVSDQGNCRIEELSSSGAFVRAFGACGSGAGQLSSPSGVALDPEGNVWVADYANNRLEEFTAAGTYMRTIGSAGTGNGQFKSPRAIAFLGGNVYVTDTANNRVQELSQAGAYVAQFGSEGSGNGQFSAPVGIAADPLSGDLYVVDDNNNRVQQFTATGTYVTKFGSAGTGAAQLKNPLGVAVNAAGTVAVIDTANNRVSQWWPTPSAVYGAAIGSSGSGNGQLSKPIDEAVDPMGNVWVTDSSNNRIEEFSPYGVFLGAYGSFGTGHGQFNSPGGIAINQTTGNIYVTDQKNGRVEELSPTGKYIAEFGKPGSGSGEFSNPYGIAIDASGNLWVVDLYNARVQEFSQSGTTFTLVRIVGKKGSGNGEFIEPYFAAFDGGNLYVTDSANNRVQEFSATGTYLAQFGSKGTGNGQFETPEGIAVDPASGTLYVADTGKNRVEEFSAAGAFLGAFGSVGTGEGQFKSPVGLSFNATGTLFVDDYGNNRIVKYAAGNVANEPPAPPEAGTTAVTTLEYKVPIHGVGAPYQMGETEVAAWAQEDDPAEAMALFPPDEVQTTPASDYRRATVIYQDILGHTVNVASPGGAISTTEYGLNNAAVRTLSAANRATALAEAKSAEAAEKLDSETIYNAEETEIEETLGPEHPVKLSSGSTVQARAHTVYHYDEGKPPGGPYRLVTKVTEGAKYSGGEADVRTRTMSYSGQANLGWTLRKPTSVTVDPGGLNLTTKTVYDPVSGNVTETIVPGAAGSGSTGSSYGYAAQATTAGTEPVALQVPASAAIDSGGHVWTIDYEGARVAEYSSTGEFIRRFGEYGTANGQFKNAVGIATDSSGNVWVADTYNNRVQEFSSTGTYLKQFGSEGIGNGQFKQPWGIAVDSSGNVWVGDAGNNRVQEFSSAGAYIRQFGSEGTGNGQFKACQAGVCYGMWLTLDASGHVWVSDSHNNRIQEFSNTGTYMTKFGTEGSGLGQLKDPKGLGFDSGGHLLVVDAENYRVQELTTGGGYINQFGKNGSGKGEFLGPLGLAVDSANNVWVTDGTAHRLQEMTEPGVFVREVTSAGTVTLPISAPQGTVVDGSGHLWVADTNANRIDELSANGEFITRFGTAGSGNGQLSHPTGIAVDAAGYIWVVDSGNNRVEQFSANGTYITQFGTVGTGNGQLKQPRGIAIDAEKHIWIADAGNNRIQEFSEAGVYMKQFGASGSGNGQFWASTGETIYGMWLTIDASGHIWVADSHNNRVQEFSLAGSYLAQFGTVGTGNGQFKEPEGIAINSSGHIFVADEGNSRIEEFSSSGTYLSAFSKSGAENGQLKAPVGIAIDSSDAVWVGDTGNNRVQKFSLAGPKVSQTIYYSTAANAAYPECGGHAEWAGLVCRTQPLSQPAASAAPQLPVTTVTYNLWDGVESSVETVGTTTRTKSSTFDAAGRLVSSSVTSSVGTAVPTVTREYSTTTGALVKTSTTVSEKTQSVSETFNSLGQMTAYQDADGNIATFKYTLDGEMEEANDGKGTQSYTYDATTHALAKVVDTAAGTFTAERDVEGRMVNENYPNGMTAKYSYDASGAATGIEYVKTTHCTEKCTWYSQSVASGIHGEMLSQSNTLASDAYVYDASGRLTQADETPAGAGCKRRIYAYDVESNRTSLTSREPGVEGVCATSGGTIENHVYDEANRVIDTGTVYDTFGDITLLPAADAGGHEVTSSYYRSGQLQSQTQSGQTLTYYLDPTGRIRETVGSGAKSSDVISHYSGGGAAPAWTSELGEKWSRNVVGIGGSLAAVQTNGETPVLQLHDLQGDIVGTAAESELETKLLSSYNSTEFGVPTTSSPPKYSWGGAGGTATELASGISNSDTSSYVPQLGRSLQTEPITAPGEFPNGSDTGAPYVSEMEPWVGESDAAWGVGGAVRDAARQAAAAAQAAAQVEGIVDPHRYYTSLAEVQERHDEFDTLAKAGEDTAGVSDIINEFLEGGAVSSVIKYFGIDAIKNWAADIAGKLLTCEEDWNIRPRHERQYCRLDFSEIKVKIGPVKFSSADYWATPHVYYCVAYTGPKKKTGHCKRLAYTDPSTLG